MRPIAFAAALSALLFATPAFAQFEGVIESKISSTGGPGATQGKGKTWVSKAGWRGEMELGMAGPGGKPMRTVMIGKKAEPDTFYTVNDATRSYAVMTAKEMEGLAGKAEKKTYTVKRQGTDTVAGFECEKALVTEQPGSTQIEVCVTRKLPVGDWLRSAQRGVRGNWMKTLQDEGLEGYPLRISTTTKDEPGFRTTVEVTKVEKRAVPASMFEVPAGYTRTSAIGVMAQDPAQAKQLEEAQRQMQEAMKNMSPEQRKMMEQMMKKGPPRE